MKKEVYTKIFKTMETAVNKLSTDYGETHTAVVSLRRAFYNLDSNATPSELRGMLERLDHLSGRQDDLLKAARQIEQLSAGVPL